jgi:hypothetical protein
MALALVLGGCGLLLYGDHRGDLQMRAVGFTVVAIALVVAVITAAPSRTPRGRRSGWVGLPPSVRDGEPHTGSRNVDEKRHAPLPGVRLLLIVAPHEPNLCRYLERSFATVRGVNVILDRRRGERRRREGGDPTVERRRGERRLRTGPMSPLGYQIVRLGSRVSVQTRETERPASHRLRSET